jgi:hypothetical protein
MHRCASNKCMCYNNMYQRCISISASQSTEILPKYSKQSLLELPEGELLLSSCHPFDPIHHSHEALHAML